MPLQQSFIDLDSPASPAPDDRNRSAASPTAWHFLTDRILLLLHIPLLAWGIFSLAFSGTSTWLDLRFAGPIVARALPILWVLTLIAITITRRANLHRLTALLLWPSYMVLACLAANTVFYVHLRAADRIDSGKDVPICLLVSLWICTWAWFIKKPRADQTIANPTARSTTRLPLLAWLYCPLTIATAFWFFYLFHYQVPPTRPVTVAVVLGHRVLDDGRASDTLAARTQSAIDLYRRGLVQHLILSGMFEDKPDGHQVSEPTAMANVCRAAGLPETALTLDPNGVNTRATVAFTTRWLADHPGATALACSSDYHLLRTRLAFAQAGLDVPVIASQPTGWIEADPLSLIRETIGLFVYRFFPSYRPALVDQMAIAHPRVVVSKAKHTLDLFDDQRLVKTYPCITGSAPGDKEVEGDRKTPLGQFRIVYKNPESKFHLSLGLDYPNAEDAARGLKSGKLTQAQYDTLLHLIQTGDMSLPEVQNAVWKTPLGGEIFIHGHGEGRTGTAGCVAVSNSDVEELYALCPVGTPVTITP